MCVSPPSGWRRRSRGSASVAPAPVPAAVPVPAAMPQEEQQTVPWLVEEDEVVVAEKDANPETMVVAEKDANPETNGKKKKRKIGGKIKNQNHQLTL